MVLGHFSVTTKTAFHKTGGATPRTTVKTAQMKQDVRLALVPAQNSGEFLLLVI